MANIYTVDSTQYGLDSLQKQRAIFEAMARAVEARNSEKADTADTTTNVAQDGSGEPAYDLSSVETNSATPQASILPTKAQITQKFGNYNPGLEPNKSGRNWGVDFGVKSGTPLALPPGEWQVIQTYDKASGRGRVGNRENAGYGNSVLVMNSRTGETMRYSHLQGVNVKPGETLRGGTVIGSSGATGNVTGAHLDLEYKVGGQFRDITQSPYAQYLFGQGGGMSSSGKGGGNPLADIQLKAKEFLDRAKYAGEVVKTLGINAAQGLGKTFIYNPENKQPFPQSPYWAIKSANEISDPELKKQALQKVATDLAMAGTINSPTAIKTTKITEALDDLARVGKNLDTVPVEPVGGEDLGYQKSQEMLNRYGKAERPTDVGFITKNGDAINYDGFNKHEDMVKSLGYTGKNRLENYLNDTGDVRVSIPYSETQLNIEIRKPITQQQYNQIEKLSPGKKVFIDNYINNKSYPESSRDISYLKQFIESNPIRKPLKEVYKEQLTKGVETPKLSVERVGGKKVYHATNKQFDNFDISKAKTDMGGAKAIFFSETPEGTKYYQRGENSRVIETNISPEAKIFDYQNPEHTALLENFIQESSKNKPEWGDSLRRLIKSGDWGTIEGKDIQGVIKKLGFDGFYDMDMTGHRAIGITNPKVISPSPIGRKVGTKKK